MNKEAGHSLSAKGRPAPHKVEDYLMSITYRDLATGSIKLVSVPELYVRLNEAVENPTASATTKIGQNHQPGPGIDGAPAQDRQQPPVRFYFQD